MDVALGSKEGEDVDNKRKKRKRRKNNHGEEEVNKGDKEAGDMDNKKRKKRKEEEDEDVDVDAARGSKEGEDTDNKKRKKKMNDNHGEGEVNRGGKEAGEIHISCKKTHNGLEETLCTAKIHENIAQPSRADLYNPRAGRISPLNSLSLPILRWFQLSAEYVLLYKNGIYAPHWNINANSLIYVTRGNGRVQIVNSQGKAVFDDVLRRGQLLLVPQNFAVAKQAGEEGFEYVAFKTNDKAVTSPLKAVIRGIPAEVLQNAFGLRQHQVSALKYNGNQGPLVYADSQIQSEDHLFLKA